MVDLIYVQIIESIETTFCVSRDFQQYSIICDVWLIKRTILIKKKSDIMSYIYIYITLNRIY